MLTKLSNLQTYIQRRRPVIGLRLRQARQHKGWTQEQTALFLECSRRRVNRVEQGITDFTIFELELLAQKFEVSLFYLLGYS